MYPVGPVKSKASVVKINSTKPSITESITKSMQSYHSISFTKKGMTFHQYFNHSKWKFVNHNKLEFQSGRVVLEPYQECIGKLIGVEGKNS